MQSNNFIAPGNGEEKHTNGEQRRIEHNYFREIDHNGCAMFKEFFRTGNKVAKLIGYTFVAARRAAGPQVEAERVAQLRLPVSGRQATAEVSR